MIKKKVINKVITKISNDKNGMKKMESRHNAKEDYITIKEVYCVVLSFANQ